MNADSYTEFTKEVEKLFKKMFKDEEDIEFLLVMLEHKENDKVGDIGVAGLGCPVCITRILAEMVVNGQIKHLSDEEEKVH